MLPERLDGEEADTARVPATREAPAASVRSLSKSFRGVRVLADVSFDVAEGEALVLLGASGSGKTTILRVIAGLERPDSGSVHLHGRDVTDLPARERGVGVIFQSYALFPRMTVEQNIGYGLRIRGRGRREIRETVARLLALVRLEEHARKYPSQLSGGQQQRVAIARSLVHEPRLLVCDEPTAALDHETGETVMHLLRDAAVRPDRAVIVVTHDNRVFHFGDVIARMDDGRLVEVRTQTPDLRPRAGHPDADEAA